MDNTKSIENPDGQTFHDRREENCPEHNPDIEHLEGSHSAHYTLPDTDDVAVRSVCGSCGDVLAEWSEKWRMVEATNVLSIGECPGCDGAAWAGRHLQVQERDGDVWHESCRMKEKYGFEDTDDDAPIASNPKTPYNLHRSVATEINGEVFEWDEYLHTGHAPDHGQYNLPTRDDLTTPQLETLREWAVGENPTGDTPLHEADTRVGVFPASFVLRGGRREDVPAKWICPDCAEVVKPKGGKYSVDLETVCSNCGSDRWLTEGGVIEESTHEELAALSDRERQVVQMDIMTARTDREIGEALGIEASTVREYRERAKSKAQRGKRLYDWLTNTGILHDN